MRTVVSSMIQFWLLYRNAKFCAISDDICFCNVQFAPAVLKFRSIYENGRTENTPELNFSGLFSSRRTNGTLWCGRQIVRRFSQLVFEIFRVLSWVQHSLARVLLHAARRSLTFYSTSSSTTTFLTTPHFHSCHGVAKKKTFSIFKCTLDSKTWFRKHNTFLEILHFRSFWFKFERTKKRSNMHEIDPTTRV